MIKEKYDAVQRWYDEAMTNEERVKEHLQQQLSRARSRYEQGFDQVLFDDAMLSTNGVLSTERRNLLISDAMALCGSPYHTMSRNHWGLEAWVFLTQYTREGGQ